METVNTVSLLVTVCDIFAVFSVRILSVCLNAVPAPLLGDVVLLTLQKRGHRKIISHSAGHSVLTGVWATKKPVHKRIPT